ncbi:hypothetical protein ABZ920_24310, partial [Streptomyces sp. NPDC046831]
VVEPWLPYSVRRQVEPFAPFGLLPSPPASRPLAPAPHRTRGHMPRPLHLLTPGGLDEFVDRVVPLLQERGVLRTRYEGATLRDHLGPSRPAARCGGAA